MPVTSHDVAQLAGVSQSTVSRVLTGDSAVRETTRQRVLAALEELNYAPNVAARTMKTGRTGAIAVVISRLTNPFYPELLDAVSEAALEAGLHVIVMNAEMDGEADAARALRARSVDGVILATATEESAKLWSGYDRSAPIVLINRVVESLPFAQITGDHVSGSAEVARFFLKHGRQRIALITAPLSASTTAEREAGFLDALAADKAPVNSGNIVRTAAVSHEEGRQAMLFLLRQPQRPTAVFCVSDLLAIGAIDAARELNISVPEDIWVVGFDNVQLASWGGYQLTTVSQPAKEMARRGVKALLDRLDKPRARTEIVRLPTQLVIRESARSWI